MVLAEASSFLQSGITAARSGNRLLARMHLEAALHQNRHDAEAWLWLAWTADSPAHAISCLEWVLAFEPENSLAQAGLEWIRRLEACPSSGTGSLSDGDGHSPWNSSDRLEAYPTVGELTELIAVDDSFAEDLSESYGLNDIDERVSNAQTLLDEIDDPWDGMRSNDFASDHGIADVADLIDAVSESDGAHRFDEVDDESFDLLCKEIEADEAEWPFDVAELTIIDDVSGCESLAVTDHTISELLDDANVQAQFEDAPFLDFNESTETYSTEPEPFGTAVSVETSADVEHPVGEVEPELADDPPLDVLFTLDQEPVAEWCCDTDELPETLDENPMSSNHRPTSRLKYRRTPSGEISIWPNGRSTSPELTNEPSKSMRASRPRLLRRSFPLPMRTPRMNRVSSIWSVLHSMAKTRTRISRVC